MRIVQAADAAPLRLRHSHFSWFNGLRALSLEGAPKSRDGMTMILHSDSLRTAASLEYLSLKNVQLSDSVPEWWIASVDVTADDQDAFQNLTYEPPSEEEQEEAYEILPYEVYKKHQADRLAADGAGVWDGLANLSKLQQLQMVGCVLPQPDALATGSFSGFGRLKQLTIESSDLKVLPPLGRADLRQLRTLSLADNGILQVQMQDLQVGMATVWPLTRLSWSKTVRIRFRIGYI